MASAVMVSRSLVVKYKVGIDSNGKDISKTLRLSKVKGDATTDELFETGLAVADLLDCMSSEISEELSNQIMG